MTGFGRTGPLFAVDRFDVVPDILAIGKGMSGGYTPIGAAVVNREIATAFRQDGASFLHGHTFGGNPLSAAITADVVERYTSDVLATGRRRGRRIAEATVAAVRTVMEDLPG
jgi:adenosylmethionine-8-amino-7-oxononanoate aminotransferase